MNINRLAGQEVLIVNGTYNNYVGIYTDRIPTRDTRNHVVLVDGKYIEYTPHELRTIPTGYWYPGVVRPEDDIKDRS